mgnify:CR=1 FL=1
MSNEEADRLRAQISQLQAQLQEKDKEYQSKCVQFDELSKLLQNLLPRQPVDVSISSLTPLPGNKSILVAVAMPFCYLLDSYKWFLFW